MRSLLRALKWSAFPLCARLRAALPIGNLRGAPTFLIGCGRSGTTALGQAIARHHSVVYFNEPVHYWYAIESQADQVNFFGGQGRCFLDAADATPKAHTRFLRLFGQGQALRGGGAVVEKLPANSLRIGWLNALCPDARFVHIIRDGRAVCRSIVELSRNDKYRVRGKSGLHQWWGRDFYKWKIFVSECRKRGLFVDAFNSIPESGPTHYQAMAVMEWLVKLRHVRAAALGLGLGPDRFLEIRYEDLIADPADTLGQIELLMELPHDKAMVQAARQTLEFRPTKSFDLRLPEPVMREFIREQERLGYSAGRARLLAAFAVAAS